MTKNHSVTKALQHNVELFEDYYQKPDWWFRFRYDTQVKRKTCLYLMRKVRQAIANQRVLEIGFGSGVVLFSLDRSCGIYGVEISHSAVERATRKAKELGYQEFEFKITSDDALSFADSFFDVVFASHVVEHVEDDRNLMMEIGRVLRPGGIAVILIPINEIYNDPNHLHRYTSARFVELARECGFHVAFQLENELLFHIVEKFYFEEYNYRWKVFGPLIAMLFNFPTSVLPFWAYQMIDRSLIRLDWKPRQFGCVLAKQPVDG